jgi:transcriptional regulator with XRE-family HTH domain
MTSPSGAAGSPLRYLPDALRALRRRRNLDQEELARRAGIGNATLSRYESGHSSPNVSKLIAVLQAMELDERDLWEEMERARAEAEGRHTIPLNLGESPASLEERLMAVYIRNSQQGRGTTWLEQMDAALERLRRVDAMVQGKGDAVDEEDRDEPPAEPKPEKQ